MIVFHDRDKLLDLSIHEPIINKIHNWATYLFSGKVFSFCILLDPSQAEVQISSPNYSDDILNADVLTQ
jgi:hypothetical protein